MPSIARSIVIDVPPERVYEAYVDFASWLRWVPHFRGISLLDAGPLALGHRARISETYSVLSRVWRVTDLQPGRSFAWAASLLPGLRLTVDHIAELEGGRTRATLALRTDGPLALAAGPIATRLSSRTFARSLAALKALLES
jgi:hypothetical protein